MVGNGCGHKVDGWVGENGFRLHLVQELDSALESVTRLMHKDSQEWDFLDLVFWGWHTWKESLPVMSLRNVSDLESIERNVGSCEEGNWAISR